MAVLRQIIEHSAEATARNKYVGHLLARSLTYAAAQIKTAENATSASSEFCIQASYHGTCVGTQHHAAQAAWNVADSPDDGKLGGKPAVEKKTGPQRPDASGTQPARNSIKRWPTESGLLSGPKFGAWPLQYPPAKGRGRHFFRFSSGPSVTVA